MINEILNYEIVRKIGEGGMGQVFLARNKSIHQFVAIKMLHPQFSTNPELRNRFRQEAMMLSALDHPNIVKFLNYVENEHGIFLIMEHVDGMTIEDFINKKNGLIVEKAAFPMMMQILDAFAYAHQRGIVHRDIKPGNIFLTNDGNIKILDFGIAQIIHEADDSQYSSGGSIEYMSPEQVTGRNIDIHSDIYSLGVLFYQMLTGKPPYNLSAMSFLDVKNAIVSKPLDRMKDTYEYISDEMQTVVDKATNKSPENRYPTCQEMRKAVFAAIKGNGGGGSRGNGDYPDAPSSSSRPNIFLIVSLSILALLLIGGGIWWFLTNNSSEKYFENYVEEWTQPIGIGEMKKGDKPALYKIVYDNDKRPVRVSRVNPGGVLVEIEDSILSHYVPVDVEYVYNNEGRLNYKNVYNQHGKLIHKVDYDDDYCEAEVTRFNLADSTLSTTENYNLVYDKAGRLNTMFYLDSLGNKTTSGGCYGEQYAYDHKGRLNRITYLDEDGKAMPNFMNVAIIDFEYLPDNTVKTRTFNEKGSPVIPTSREVKAEAKVKNGSHGKGKGKKNEGYRPEKMLPKKGINKKDGDIRRKESNDRSHKVPNISPTRDKTERKKNMADQLNEK